MVTCLARGVVFGVFDVSKAPLLPSKTAHFIVLLQSHMIMNARISLSRCTSVIASHKVVEREMYSASVVDKNVSDYDYYFNVMGKLACFITNAILEHTNAGSSAHNLSKRPAKLMSEKIPNPLLTSGTQIRTSSAVPRKYFTVHLILSVHEERNIIDAGISSLRTKMLT